MHKVAFASFGDNVASSRLRAIIPRNELAKLGVKYGKDVIVYGKSFIKMDELKPYGKRVFDVCDDHFGKSHDAYYREHIAKADLVTCNSNTMAEIIRQETGRIATVIPDPYESEEQPADAGEGVLWFGHETNLVDLDPSLDLKPEILTGSNWSREKQLAALKACGCVIIPTGKSMAKSANRMIESVRNGRFVVAGELPAHDEFAGWMWVGKDLHEGVEWFNRYRTEAIEEVKSCQNYIREHYSPERIGRLWFNALGQL